MQQVRPTACPSVTTERIFITYVSRFTLMVPSLCLNSDSATEWVTGGLDFDSRQKQKMFFFLRIPDRFWGSESLIFSTYRGLFRRKQNNQCVKLAFSL